MKHWTAVTFIVRLSRSALPASSSRQQLLPALQSRSPSRYSKLNWSGCLESNFISSNYFSLPNLFPYVSSDKLGLTSSKLWCLSSSMLLKLPLLSNGPGEKRFKRYNYFMWIFLHTCTEREIHVTKEVYLLPWDNFTFKKWKAVGKILSIINNLVKFLNSMNFEIFFPTCR